MKIEDFEEKFEELEDDLKGQCKLIIGSARDWKNKGDEILQTLNTERIQLSQLLSNNQKLNNEILEEIKSNKDELNKVKENLNSDLKNIKSDNKNNLKYIKIYTSLTLLLHIIFVLSWLIMWWGFNLSKEIMATLFVAIILGCILSIYYLFFGKK